MISLLNAMAADDVAALLDRHGGDHYGPEVERFIPRPQALAIVHAALWGHASRSDSTSGAYAGIALYEALGLKGWTFDEEEAEALRRFRIERAAARRAADPAPEIEHPLLPKRRDP